MSFHQRLAVIVVVGILVVAGVLVVGFGLIDQQTGQAPDDSASTTPSPIASVTQTVAPSLAPSASAGARPSTAADIAAELAEIEQQVIAIRGLPAAGIGPPDIIARSALDEELESIYDAEFPPEERQRTNIFLRALGLLQPGEDIVELQLQLLGDQVLGFYNPTDKRMVVVSDTGLTTGARVTYAHEYTHALQDAAFGLDSLETDAEDADDRVLARTALTEGDASVSMLAWMFQHLGPDEILDYIGSVEVPDTTGIPSWMVAELSFPYEDGLTWATQLAGGDPTSPDFTALDTAYETPPDSTEQIIDIDKWSPREVPEAIEEPVDLVATLGAGWTEVESTPVGQAKIEIVLTFFGVPAEDAAAAASGWGGDRVVAAAGPADAFALAWRLSWESASEAAEFADAYRAALSALGFPASVTELSEGEILVVHASTEALRAQTVDAAS